MIGNPLTYYNGWNFTWEEGRRLASASHGSDSVSYQYNADGLRTSKTVNGVTTRYDLEDGNIAWQADGTNTVHYSYDANGDLVYMTLNGTIYYYERNGQDDIIGLVDSNMNEVVTYTYDSWGNPLGTGGSLASTVGAVNPFRYRGYCYDSDTGLYYLQSRYYDPNTGRFLNADDTDTLGADNENLISENLFAYCGNNPVMNSDPDGQFAFAIPVVAVGAIVLAIVAVSAYYFSTPAGQRSWNGLGRAVYNRFRPWQIAWNRAVSGIRSGIYYARNKTPKGRPALKKQGRESLEKKKGNDKYKPNPNKSQRTQPRPHHPSKKGHRKYPQD